MGDESPFVVVHVIKGNKMLADEMAATNPERDDIYPVDGVPVPMVFEIPKVVTPFVYRDADGNMKTCVPEKKRGYVRSATRKGPVCRMARKLGDAHRRCR